MGSAFCLVHRNDLPVVELWDQLLPAAEKTCWVVEGASGYSLDFELAVELPVVVIEAGDISYKFDFPPAVLYPNSSLLVCYWRERRRSLAALLPLSVIIAQAAAVAVPVVRCYPSVWLPYFSSGNPSYCMVRARVAWRGSFSLPLYRRCFWGEWTAAPRAGLAAVPAASSASLPARLALVKSSPAPTCPPKIINRFK